MNGFDHIERRKGRTGSLEPFPARTKWKRRLDRTVFVVGIMGPLTAIPQILKIYLLHHAGGVSAVAWVLAMILDIPWIVYGIVHNERPILVTYTLWLFMNATVAFGALMRGSGLL